MLSQKDREYVSNTSQRGATITICRAAPSTFRWCAVRMYEMFQAFDLPDPSTPNGDRNSTVIAPQALFMMNATLVLKSHPGHGVEAARESRRFGRCRPHPRGLRKGAGKAAGGERCRSRADLHRPGGKGDGRRAKRTRPSRRLFAWQSFCKALLSSNEFIYVN